MNKIFQDKSVVNKIVEVIKKEVDLNRNYRIMEVCGTHTMAIAKHGIASILPNNIELVSGPGCPVCVTSQSDLDNCINLAGKTNIAVATFGDMLRVIGSDGNSLYEAKAKGDDVRIIYSPMDILKMAKDEPSKEFVFLAVGFETTTPLAAALIKTAYEQDIKNISVITICKTMPEIFSKLLSFENVNVDGFLCPGNVTIVTGTSIYEPLVGAGKAAVVSGFEPVDILSSILEIIRQINRQQFTVVNNYTRASKTEGNLQAQRLTNEVFEPADARWRGLGILKNSGLKVRDKYKDYDAYLKFNIEPNAPEKATACRCADVLIGAIKPSGCSMFGVTCMPERAIGPCMVSSEGTCAAYYKYLRHSK